MIQVRLSQTTFWLNPCNFSSTFIVFLYNIFLNIKIRFLIFGFRGYAQNIFPFSCLALIPIRKYYFETKLKFDHMFKFLKFFFMDVDRDEFGLPSSCVGFNQLMVLFGGPCHLYCFEPSSLSPFRQKSPRLSC